MMFNTESLSKYVGAKKLLKACSIKVKPGRIMAVVGPNGAGKSTLLKMMAGEMAPTSGQIWINNADLRNQKIKSLSQTRAILPQQTVVNFPFTVEQVIEIGRYAHPTTSKKNKEVINEVMTLTGLTEFKGRNYQSLSGGEQQRVQLARVIAQIHDYHPSPRYLLLDEPTSSLDLAQQQSFMSLVKGLCRRNIGILAILHDLNLAIQYADDILLLKNGETMANGDLEQVLNRETIEKTFSYPVRLISDGSRRFVIPDGNSSAQSHYVNKISYGQFNYN